MWWLAGNQAVDQPPTALSLGCAAGQSAALGLCMGQLASAPGAHPPEVSGVGSQLGFQFWAPSPLIWVCTMGLQVSTGAGYPLFTVQGAEGGGAPEAGGLLQRVL